MQFSSVCNFDSKLQEFRIRIRNCFVSCRLGKQIEITKEGCHISMYKHLLHCWTKRLTQFYSLAYFHVQTLDSSSAHVVISLVFFSLLVFVEFWVKFDGLKSKTKKNHIICGGEKGAWPFTNS